jgi:DNA topoisomerase-1
LPHLRAVSDEHLRQRTLSRERVLAAMVRLLETTLIRIGNDEYAQKNDSRGLTTLEDDHAEVRGSQIVFDFVGKSGKEHTIALRDRRLARVVKQCQDIPGYELFQYYDENGEHRVVDSSDVNAYLQEVTGQPFTAKVFRTWGGSTLAIKYLAEQCREADDTTAARECVAHVAESLGNTKAISRDYYIHPLVLQAQQDGTLQAIYDEQVKQPSGEYELAPEERTLMQLIARTNGYE